MQVVLKAEERDGLPHGQSNQIVKQVLVLQEQQIQVREDQAEPVHLLQVLQEVAVDQAL
tara:strand:+ start:367 stop:543 length:177 start_codon:yes stop_codon:yes gene_type:complete